MRELAVRQAMWHGLVLMSLLFPIPWLLPPPDCLACSQVPSRVGASARKRQCAESPREQSAARTAAAVSVTVSSPEAEAVRSVKLCAIGSRYLVRLLAARTPRKFFVVLQRPRAETTLSMPLTRSAREIVGEEMKLETVADAFAAATNFFRSESTLLSSLAFTAELYRPVA